MLTQRLNVMLSEVEASPFNAILRSFTSVIDFGPFGRRALFAALIESYD